VGEVGLDYGAGIEYLGNLSEENTPTGRVAPFGDNRAAGYQPLANPWDTFTELVLVYKLL
jgi:hypothetical protein